jgi:hypothetical protein
MTVSISLEGTAFLKQAARSSSSKKERESAIRGLACEGKQN